MKSIFDFVVKPLGGRSKNKKQIGEKQLILNTDLQDHRYVNRNAVVISNQQTTFSGSKVDGFAWDCKSLR